MTLTLLSLVLSNLVSKDIIVILRAQGALGFHYGLFIHASYSPANNIQWLE